MAVTAQEKYDQLVPGASLEDVLAIGRAFLEDEGDIPPTVTLSLMEACDDDAVGEQLEQLRVEYFRARGVEPPEQPILE